MESTIAKDDEELANLMKSELTSGSMPRLQGGGGPLPILSVNHLSLLCSSVEKSSCFYKDILGFVPIKRPGALGSRGAWYVCK